MKQVFMKALAKSLTVSVVGSPIWHEVIIYRLAISNVCLLIGQFNSCKLVHWLGYLSTSGP